MSKDLPPTEQEKLLDSTKDLNGPGPFLDEAPRLTGGRRIGPYEIKRCLGTGGMGDVYLAVRVDDYQQEVAVKLIKRGMDTDEVLRRFLIERQVLADLKHPNIARILDGGTSTDGFPYFVMEYIDGIPLDAYCQGRTLPVRERVQLLLTVCRAVDHAHRRNVIHRDLKPANILVASGGTPFVMDFGLSKRLPIGGGKTVSKEQTVSGAIVGTPQYMAPEQASGKSKDIGPATDVYGLGAILYVLLTDRAPFQGENVLETLQSVVEQEPEPPRKIRPDVDWDLEVICLKCLEKDPRQRYPSVQELAEDLERWLNGQPIQARRQGKAAKLWRRFRRRPLAIALTVFAILALVIGASTYVFLFDGGNPEVTATPEKRPKSPPLKPSEDPDFWEVRCAQPGTLFVLGSEPEPGKKVPADQLFTIKVGQEAKTFRRLHEGDPIKEGQLIGWIDPTLALEELTIKTGKALSAKADQDKAKAAFLVAMYQFNQADKLFKKATKDMSLADWGNYKRALEVCKRETIKAPLAVAIAEAEERLAQVFLRKYEIRSPVAGKLKTIVKRKGDVLREGEAVLSFSIVRSPEMPAILGKRSEDPNLREVRCAQSGALLVLGTEPEPGQKVPADQAITVNVSNERKTFCRLHQGDAIKEGQLLGLIDPSLALAELAVKTAKVAFAKADYEFTKEKLWEAEQITKAAEAKFKKNGMAKDELTYHQESVKLWKSEKEKAFQAIEVAMGEERLTKAILMKHEIRSPVAGKLRAILKWKGDVLREGEAVFQIQVSE
jgi:multidrug efflux pump subunit AcrA (membrane-fusion protein)